MASWLLSSWKTRPREPVAPLVTACLPRWARAFAGEVTGNELPASLGCGLRNVPALEACGLARLLGDLSVSRGSQIYCLKPPKGPRLVGCLSPLASKPVAQPDGLVILFWLVPLGLGRTCRLRVRPRDSQPQTSPRPRTIPAHVIPPPGFYQLFTRATASEVTLPSFSPSPTPASPPPAPQQSQEPQPQSTRGLSPESPRHTGRCALSTPSALFKPPLQPGFPSPVLSGHSATL